MSPFLRLLRYARPHRGRLAAALLAMGLYAVGSAGLAYLIKPIVDEVLPNREQVGLVAAGLIGLFLMKGVGSFLAAYLMTDVGQRVVRDLRNALFAHMLGQSAGFFVRRTTGQLLSRITNDVNQVQQAVSETFGDLSRESLALVGYAALLFYLDAGLALVCMTGAPLVVYPLIRLGQRVRRTTRRSQEALERISHLAAEAFTGHRIVKAFSMERHEAEKFDVASQRLYRTKMKAVSALASLPPLMELLGGVGMAVAIWYGSREIAVGRMTPGEFTAFFAAALLMYGPVKKLSRVTGTIQQSLAAAERIFEILDIDTEVRDRPGARALDDLREGIAFRNVSFVYEGAPRATLQDVTLHVRKGEIVAIVGLSGAGKTTLVNLIPRFYDVTGGAILIDDTDTRDVTLVSLRSQIGMVTQDTVLFDDTIGNNIRYGRPGASEAALEAAARAAHAHEFVVALPEGYDTRIGERGQRLSGGQRQRLAIARALLKNAPILILDEATSSLDAESERLVQEALQNLMRDRTSFVIAHRLSTVRRADRIVVLERGRVAETGRHDELLGRPEGVYSRLYALQIFDETRARRTERQPSETLQSVPSADARGWRSGS